MKIHTVVVGPIRTNCYLIEDENSKEAIILDPGDEPEKILDEIKKNQLKPKYIVNTHGHFDHVTGNPKLKEKLNIPILAHPLDAQITAATISLPVDQLLTEGDLIKVGKITFTVIHTPGHTPGGICLYCKEEKVLFSGDTLFYGTYGRTDLPYSSEKAMQESLNKLMQLPPETRVYPGHDRPTTIGQEKQNLTSNSD